VIVASSLPNFAKIGSGAKKCQNRPASNRNTGFPDSNDTMYMQAYGR